MKSSDFRKKEVSLSRQQEEQIVKAFKLLDRDGQGFIENRQLKLFFIALGFQLKKEELKQMIVQNEKNGIIQFQKARALAERKMATRDPHDQILKAYKMFDEQARGKINIKDLKKASRQLGQVYTQQQLQQMIVQASSSTQGQVSQEDFIRLMGKTKLFGVMN